jgi:hypothetical protein
MVNQIGLFTSDATNNIPIDTLTYDAQTTDISKGRKPDGSNTWVVFTTPTPGASNN